MSWEDANKDLDAYQQTLDAQKAAGADARIAEGRARSKAIRAHRDANPEEAAAHAAPRSRVSVIPRTTPRHDARIPSR